MASLDFSYSRSSFLLTTILLLIAAAMIILIFAGMSSDIITIAVVVSLCLLVIFSYGISPMLTSHTLTDDQLVLRQGVLFKTSIPLTSIRSVERREKGPRKTGVYLVTRRKELFVTSRRTNLIVIQLNRPQRFRMAFGRYADTVEFDCLETDTMFRYIRDRITPASPNLGSALRP